MTDSVMVLSIINPNHSTESFWRASPQTSHPCFALYTMGVRSTGALFIINWYATVGWL